MLGNPGGGKSFEAVVYHVLEQVKRGRKVITNLPLNLDYFDIVEQGSSNLIQLIESTKDNPIPFKTITDYGDEWRHPDTGVGPFYVIDECHKALRRGEAHKEVEEWFAEHRHEYADVLLITQSYGKISRPIIDIVQVVYRVKKATAFGTNNKYIRKVQDGIRGEIINTSIRKYQKKFFPLYNSHTKSNAEGLEEGTDDVVALWRKWPFIGAGACFLLTIYFIFSGALVPPIYSEETEIKPSAAQKPENNKAIKLHKNIHAKNVDPVKIEPITEPVQIEPEVVDLPFAESQMHILGLMQNTKKSMYGISVSQNGQSVMRMTSRDLEKAGWVVEGITACSLKISSEDYHRFLTCDSPTIGVKVAIGSHGRAPASHAGGAQEQPIKLAVSDYSNQEERPTIWGGDRIK